MRVYIWCDGAAMPNGGSAGAGYVVVGGVQLLGSADRSRFTTGCQWSRMHPEPPHPPTVQGTTLTGP